MAPDDCYREMQYNNFPPMKVVINLNKLGVILLSSYKAEDEPESQNQTEEEEEIPMSKDSLREQLNKEFRKERERKKSKPNVEPPKPTGIGMNKMDALVLFCNVAYTQTWIGDTGNGPCDSE